MKIQMFVMLLLIAGIVHSYTPDDIFKNMVEVHSGISDGYAIFDISNPYPTPISINIDKITNEIIEEGDATDITSIKYYYLTKINISEDSTECRIQSKGKAGNLSDIFEQSCTKTKTNKEIEQYLPLTKSDIILQPSKTRRFKVEIVYSAKLGISKRDWIPTLSLSGISYRQSKWVWFNQSWFNRIQINISQYRDNDTVYVNLSTLGITCSNVNCTDAVIVDQNDRELKFSDGRLAWQVLLDNVTSRNYPKNDVMVFVPQNNSLKYWIYWNNPSINQRGGSIILWEDNFERYSIGDMPLKSSSTTGASTAGVCQPISGNKGVGCNISGGNRISWNIGEYKNVTVQWEINSSISNTNSIIVSIFGNTTYRAPQTGTTNTYSAFNASGNNFFGANVSFTGSAATGYNLSSQMNGINISFWINHGYSTRGGGGDTNFTNVGNEISYEPAVEDKSLISLRAWNISVVTYSNQTLIAQQSSIQTFNIFINLTSPLPIITINDSVLLTFRVQGNSSSYPCWYQINSNTTSLGSISNNTIVNQIVSTADGSNSLTVICQNNGENTTDSVAFTTLYYNLSLQFPADVIETQTTTFNVTITTAPSVSDVSSVVLNYNGSTYSASRTAVTSTSYSYRNSISIPVITANSPSEVKSFFYNISLLYSNGSSVTVLSSTSNHTVYRLNITNCTGSGQTINFTMYNEQTTTQKVVGNLYISFSLWIGDGTTIREYGFNSSNLTSHAFCLFPQNSSVSASVSAQYDGLTYSTRNFYIDNGVLSNSTQYVSLYLLNNLSSNLITFVVKEQSGIVLSNVLVKVQKYYQSEVLFRQVAMGRTNQEGKAFINLEVPYPSYKFIVEQNGVALLTTQSQQIDLNGLIITINQQTPNVYNVYDKVYANCITNTTSKIISCTYTDTSGASGVYNLSVSSVGPTLLNQVCSQELTASSGTLICDLTSSANGTYFYDFSSRYEDGSKIPLKSGSIRIGYVQRFGESGYFLAFLLFLTLFFIGMPNPTASMILGIVALVASSILELQPVQFASISSMFFVVMIALWRTK